MPEVPDTVKAMLLGGALVLLYAFAWVSTSPLPRLARALSRLGLTLLTALPFVLLVVFGDRSLPGSAQSPQMPPPIVAEAPETVEPSKPPKKSEPPAREEPAEPSGGEGPPSDREPVTPPAPPPPPPAPAPVPSKPAAPGSTSGSAPGPVPSPDGEATRGYKPPVGEPAPTDDAAAEAPPVGGVPAAEEDPYDVVPVYFGTDRAEAATPKRLDYGSQRARKLTLGRALVTVPKAHEVPSVERPWALRIPYLNITLYEEAEDPKQHFTMQELKALPREEFLALVRERLAKSERFKDHALVFIHGFNTTFDNGIYRTAQMAYDLKFDGAAFHYSWPSGGGLASYTYDRESAGQSQPFLREFLELAVKESGAKSVSVIAHSMGNQPVLQVLRDIRASSPDGAVINQIILAAPDVDRDNFENIAKDIQGLARGITLYAASNDRALTVSRRFHGGVPRAGDVPEGMPLVVSGVDTIDVTAVSTDSLGLNHSGYAENNAILNDIQLLIQTGERPPEKRVPILEKIPSASGDFWRYPKPN